MKKYADLRRAALKAIEQDDKRAKQLVELWNEEADFYNYTHPVYDTSPIRSNHVMG